VESCAIWSHHNLLPWLSQQADCIFYHPNGSVCIISKDQNNPNYGRKEHQYTLMSHDMLIEIYTNTYKKIE
jgi:hypothetical protein